MAGAVFRIRVLVPPSIAWCCFGIDAGQSRQRDCRNIGLRTLWLGGFLGDSPGSCECSWSWSPRATSSRGSPSFCVRNLDIGHPFVEDRPGDAHGAGHVLRWRLPRCERDDGLPLLVVGERARLGAPAAPARLQLVHPTREQLLGFRVSELADGAGGALPVIEEVVDDGPLLEIIVAPMAPSAQAPVSANSMYHSLRVWRLG